MYTGVSIVLRRDQRGWLCTLARMGSKEWDFRMGGRWTKVRGRNTSMLYITLEGFTVFDCCRFTHLGGSFLWPPLIRNLYMGGRGGGRGV